MRVLTLLALAVPFAATLSAQATPSAIFTDPAQDSLHPARMEVLHIPSGRVRINGVAYLAPGDSAHPTLIILHGLPGNEKNLDLAQAVRRASWNAITFNYRGSWGSPGMFRFAHTIEDGSAVLAFLRDTARVRLLRIDTTRIVLAGHSMGGWATAQLASRDKRLAGAILISAADMGLDARTPRARLVTAMRSNMESLAGVTAEQMADELIANGRRWQFDRTAAGLGRLPLLVLTSNDGLAPEVEPLVAGARAAGNSRVTVQHESTDHGWSDRRIALQSAVIRWIENLP